MTMKNKELERSFPGFQNLPFLPDKLSTMEWEFAKKITGSKSAKGKGYRVVIFSPDWKPIELVDNKSVSDVVNGLRRRRGSDIPRYATVEGAYGTYSLVKIPVSQIEEDFPDIGKVFSPDTLMGLKRRSYDEVKDSIHGTLGMSETDITLYDSSWSEVGSVKEGDTVAKLATAYQGRAAFVVVSSTYRGGGGVSREVAQL